MCSPQPHGVAVLERADDFLRKLPVLENDQFPKLDGSMTAAKAAGHTEERTTAQVYDRDRLEAFRRFQSARLKCRNE